MYVSATVANDASSGIEIEERRQSAVQLRLPPEELVMTTDLVGQGFTEDVHRLGGWFFEESHNVRNDRCSASW